MSGVTRIFRSLASIAGVLLFTTTSLQAGGLAVREQSTSGLGSAFAGVAAGGDLSSMYWNPAERTSFDFAYTHIFIDDAVADQTSVSGLTTVVSDVESSSDIVAVSFKRKLGGASRTALK